MTTTDATRDQQIAVIVTRPYRKVIHGDAVQGFLGEVLELPGCMTAGDSETEALINLRDAMEAWVESALIDDLPIPEPLEADPGADDVLLVRLPGGIHRLLQDRAAAEGVSPHALALTLITHGLRLLTNQDPN